jgi:hypothetical protein
MEVVLLKLNILQEAHIITRYSGKHFKRKPMAELIVSGETEILDYS